VTGWGIAGSTDPIAQVERRLAERPALATFLSARDWRADFARSVLPLHAHLRPLLDRLTPLWAHGDWHPSNLFWGDDNEVSTVIDFGLSDQTSAVIDIATAIERTCVPWLDLGNASAAADIPTAVAFVTAYSEVRALSPVEYTALPLVLPLVHIDFALSEVDYFVAALDDSERAAVAYDDFLLAHADWFSSPAGRALTDVLSALTVSRAD
jgi:Ser/Thr protein kinase RdoA (MazF antagonist)